MTDEEIAQRFDDGSASFEEIRKSLLEINKKLEVLPQMQKDVAAAKRSTTRVKELVEAWNFIKTGGKFVRWVAPVVAAIVGAYVAVKGNLVGIFK